MGAERVERRLAAILEADVAGYSRLMERDEAGTLARLRTLRRDLIDPKIAEHKGRIVKTTGDGLLIEFPSVVEAVACAIAVQREMGAREEQSPGEREDGDRKRPARQHQVKRIAESRRLCAADHGSSSPTTSMNWSRRLRAATMNRRRSSTGGR